MSHISQNLEPDEGQDEAQIPGTKPRTVTHPTAYMLRIALIAIPIVIVLLIFGLALMGSSMNSFYSNITLGL